MPESPVLHAADLIRVDLSASERASLGAELDRILHYFDSLRALDLARVEPVSHVIAITCPRRTDEPVAADLDWSATFRCLRHRFFFVPAVIEGD